MIGRRSITAALAALLAAGAFPAFVRANPLAPPLCGTEVGSRVAGAKKKSLRVATFNVLHGLEETLDDANGDGVPDYPAHSTLDTRLDMSVAQLSASGVDVVGMQEVSLTAHAEGPPEKFGELGHHANGLVVERLAQELAALPNGFTWYWCYYLANPHFVGEPDVQPGGGGPLSEEIAKLASERYASFKEGVAILSRYPILESEGRRLPGRLPVEHAFCPPLSPDEVPPICSATIVFESRAAIWASLGTPGGSTHIVSTHLSHDITQVSDASSLEQAAAALAFSEEKAAADPPARRFFVCDCNVQPTDEVPLVAFVEEAGWTNTFTRPCTASNMSGCTAGPDVVLTAGPSRLMNERLDYVFWRAGSCTAAPTKGASFVKDPTPHLGGYLWASDHLGVRTNVSTCV